MWYFYPFFYIFLVFYRYFEKPLVKIWLIIGIFGRTKICWYLVSVVAISLVSVWFRFEIFLKMAPLVWTLDSLSVCVNVYCMVSVLLTDWEVGSRTREG